MEIVNEINIDLDLMSKLQLKKNSLEEYSGYVRYQYLMNHQNLIKYLKYLFPKQSFLLPPRYYL